MRSKSLCSILLLSAILAGCGSTAQRAPVIEHSDTAKKQAVAAEVVPKAQAAPKKEPREKDWRPDSYVVQKGDTLYSIAFNHGLDYHELASANGVQDVNVIQVGQQLRLFSSTTIRPAAVVESKPIEAPLPIEARIKDQPKLAKLPYSEDAEAKIVKAQEIAKVQEATKPVVSVEAKPKPEAKPETKSETASEGDDIDPDSLEWSLPTKGKVIGEFSESANRKGIDIAGNLGQPVLASAPGKVVYSGSGLRGYGKLIIIKHNNTYLSAYAHNDQILVKEGQNITRGQKIAEMGNSDADQVKLHFEVRRFGKPVDPAKYLALRKS